MRPTIMERTVQNGSRDVVCRMTETYCAKIVSDKVYLASTESILCAENLVNIMLQRYQQSDTVVRYEYKKKGS